MYGQEHDASVREVGYATSLQGARIGRVEQDGFLTASERNQKLAQAAPRDTPERALMAVSLDEASKAVEQLAFQVEELLSTISPICQAQGGSVGDAESKAPTEVASPVRAQVIKLRDRVEGIARRISSVRYTIEI